MWLVEEIKRESVGGFAMSSTQIKTKLNNYIHKVWTKKWKVHLLPAHISPMTINSFISMIKSQCVFNLYDTISNKTESRAIAEWSIRSTLAFTTVVACTHFLLFATNTHFIQKRRIYQRIQLNYGIYLSIVIVK